MNNYPFMVCEMPGVSWKISFFIIVIVIIIIIIILINNNLKRSRNLFKDIFFLNTRGIYSTNRNGISIMFSFIKV